MLLFFSMIRACRPGNGNGEIRPMPPRMNSTARTTEGMCRAIVIELLMS